MAAKATKKARLKKKVYAYHLKYPDTKFYKYHDINPDFPKSHNTIKAWIEELGEVKDENGKSLKEEYREKINRDNKAIFDFLENDTENTIDLITTLKKALKAKALKAEDDMFTNIKDIAVTYGIIIEKEITLRELQIKHQKLDIEKKRFELEKSKFEDVIKNPENHRAQVTIINDAPPVVEEKVEAVIYESS